MNEVKSHLSYEEQINTLREKGDIFIHGYCSCQL